MAESDSAASDGVPGLEFRIELVNAIGLGFQFVGVFSLIHCVKNVIRLFYKNI